MPQTFEWTGRIDPEDGPLAKRWHQIVTSLDAKDPSAATLGALVGFACDLGVARNKGRKGAAAGPDAIRQALANLAWHGGEGQMLDLGNVVVTDSDQDPLEAAQEALGDKVAAALGASGSALVLGGGHETAAGSFNGLLKALEDQPDKTIGILNLDAHFDLRKPGEAGVSSGTPFYQIHEALQKRGQAMHYLCLGVAEGSNTAALFQRAADWDVQYLLDSEITAHDLGPTLTKIDAFLEPCDLLYLTIDLDVLPHWQMPAVSAPAAYGVSLEVIEMIIRHLGQKDIPWPLADLVEYNPDFDPDGRAAKVVARLTDRIMRKLG